MFPLIFPRMIVVGAVLATASLSAQSPVVPVTPDTVPAGQSAVEPAQQKSVGEAVVISLASTYGPAVLAMATHNSGAEFATGVGILIGPSTGYWYAGSGKWKSGLIARGVAAGVGTAGLFLASQCLFSASTTSSCGIGELLAIGGSAVVVVSGIVDIAKLPSAVRAERVPTLAVAPVIGPGARSAGLSIQLRF